VRTPVDLARWARKHGLLGVYIDFTTNIGFLPAHWQVRREGHRTDASAPAWARGNKTFVVRSVAEKHAKEQIACAWGSAHYGVASWVRIEGLGVALFPEAVAEELRRHVPDVRVRNLRRSS
jgi:hypothetical protein